ncbi:cytochrome c-type biogenesis protein [Carnimonas bestiolae]|uniref:cytochrome c-type biogenesis protein n=1 Tax=Carnimonas bestiolae TaxID=3402172 RepID=UPI003EDCA971
MRDAMLKRLLLLSAALLLCALAGVSLADNGPPEFHDSALAQRYSALTEELRCPKCENETLASSGAPIAADIRQRIAEWLNAGQSDDDIRHHLVQRFGEYVLYKPRVERRTWLLWGLPAAAVVIGGVVLTLLIRRRRRLQVSDLDDAERARLAALLSRHGDQQPSSDREAR